MITAIKGIFDNLNNFLFSIFKTKKQVRIGLYGPPNAGKTSIANKICMDWIGEEMGKVSPIAHETREVKEKQSIKINSHNKSLVFNLVDTPGIATRIDYEDFLKHNLKEEEAKKRAKEATKGVIEAIKWLDKMDCVLVVIDATENPYSQVNVTIIGNLAAREIPVVVVANKVDLKKANIKRVESAFPQYKVVGVSALKGKNFDRLYEEMFRLVK